MLTLVLSSLLACPPTTYSKQVDDDRNARGIVQEQSAWPEASLLDEDPAAPILHPPQAPTLPLWDLERTIAELPKDHEDRQWLLWALEDSKRGPAWGYDHLVHALASTSSPERMLWWLARMPTNVDARDALSAAYERAGSIQTQLMLAIALAVAHTDASCPVEPGADGTCRIRGVLVHRDSIALERANAWTKAARKLAKRAKLDPSDLAMQALLAELELASSLGDHESLLSVRAPDDLMFNAQEWLEDSGLPAWERQYEREVESVIDSRRRYRSFNATHEACMSSQFEALERSETASADAAMHGSLRRAELLFAHVEALEAGSRDFRDFDRRSARSPRSSGRDGWYYEPPREQAIDLAEQCVEIGTTIGGDADLLEACFDFLETHDPRHHAPQAELVPEPGALTIMHSSGLIPPQPSEQQRNPVE